MDFGATISRAFNVVLKNRALWFLGFLAALAGGGGASFNLPSGNFGGMGTGTGSGPGEIPPEMQRFFDMLQENIGAIIAGVAGLVCVVLVISLVLWVISTIAEGGLIGGVDQIEREGVTTLGQSWRMGASKFWPLFLMGILLALPILIIAAIAVVLLGGSFAAIAASAAQGSGETPDAALASAGIGVVCIGGVLACLGAIYSILAAALQTFGSRAVVLDNLGVMDALRKGWEVFRANLGNIILLAIIMLVVGWVVGLVIGLVSAAIFAPALISGFTDISRSSEGFNLSGSTIVLAIIAFIAVTIVGAIISALFTAFNSTAWTLAYRQFTGRGLTTTSSVTPPSLPPVPPLPTAQ